MTRVLIDTSAWVAIEDRRDQWHAPASLTWNSLLKRAPRILVSTWILSETISLVGSRATLERAYVLGRRMLDSDQFEIVRGDAGLESRALLVQRQRGDPRFSFTDAASWVIAREREVDAVFSFDRHLRIPGIAFLPEDGGWEVRERPGRYRAGARRRRTRRISSITATHSASEL